MFGYWLCFRIFSGKSAGQGLLTLGIDDLSQDLNRLHNAKSEHGGSRNIAFGNWRVTPDNVSDLPDFDIILTMTVYHHFVKAFGKESADEMMREIYTKCDFLVVEFPGWRWTGLPFTIDMDPTTGDETIELRNHEELSPYGSRIRPKLHKHVDLGEYEISIRADGYEDSNVIHYDVTGQTPRHLRPKIDFRDSQIRLVSGEKAGSEIDGIIEWYNCLMEEIFPDSMEIIDKKVIDIKEDGRKNIVYVLGDSVNKL